MSKNIVSVRLNRAAFDAQVLRAPGVTDACVRVAENGARKHKGILSVARNTTGRTRRGAAVFAPASANQKSGGKLLDHAIGRMRL